MAVQPETRNRDWLGNATYAIYKAGRQVCRLPIVGALVPATLRRKLQWRLASRTMAHLPDRRYMEEAILPALSKLPPCRVLDVGIEFYSQHYYRWFEDGFEYWTIDIVADLARYGRPGRHIVGDVRDVGSHFEAGSLGVVLLNGPFGYGVDLLVEQEAVIETMARLLRPGGYMLVGWDLAEDGLPVVVAGRRPGHVRDPRELEATRRYFRHEAPSSLNRHVVFDDCSHVYDWFCRAD